MPEPTDNPFQSPQAVDSDAALPEVGPPYVFAGFTEAHQFIEGLTLARKGTALGAIKSAVTWVIPTLAVMAVLNFAFMFLVYKSIALLPAMVVLAIGLGVVSWIVRKDTAKIQRDIDEINRIDGELSFAVSESGVATTSAAGDKNQNWSDFIGFRSAANVTVIFLDTTTFLSFHRTQLKTDDAWPSFQRFIAERLPRK